MHDHEAKLANRPTKDGEGMASREMARTALLAAADRLRRRAHQLEALAYQTEHVRGEAEEMLWELVSSYRGRI